jgi:hypothetical protein
MMGAWDIFSRLFLLLLYLEIGVGRRNVTRSITAIFEAVAVALTFSY